jgi:dTDP-4-dehydrorhamnose reductase
LNILLTGGPGQLRQELLERLRLVGELRTPDLDELDFTKPETVRNVLEGFRPDVIVNPAAYTAVDLAETERDPAYAVNVEGPKLLASWARDRGAFLIHYSTDYVFDGSGSKQWVETDPTGPLNVYGASKLAGENAIREIDPPHVILRTSWLYSPVGKNFLLTMLNLGRDREELRVVSDQIGAPTSAEVVAEATIEVLESESFPECRGTYHLTCTGETSWHGFASAIFEGARARGWPLKVRNVVPILSSDYPTPARRPMNSRLSVAKFSETFGWTPPDWKLALERTLDRIV